MASQAAPHPLVQKGALNQTLTPDNFLDGDTVMMNFPRTVKLQLDDGAGTVTFFPGVQEVPALLANHWWLRDNGATPFHRGRVRASSNAPSSENKIQKMTERELLYLQSKGYQITGLQETQLFYDGMEPMMRPEFLKSVDVWWSAKIKTDSEQSNSGSSQKSKSKKAEKGAA
jgi:hypothetical protein